MSSADPAQSSNRGIFAEVVRLQRAGRTCVLAVPLWSRGSVPLRHHSKLLRRDDGTIQGTIGGGLLEADVLAAAPQVMSQGTPRVLEFDLTPTDAAESGMICGGRCAVLLEPITPDYAPDIFAAAARAERTGEPIVLITLLPPEGPAARPGPTPECHSERDRLRRTTRRIPPLPGAAPESIIACEERPRRPTKLALTSNDTLLGSTGDPALDQHLAALAQQARAGEKPAFIEDPLPAHLDPILPHPTLCIFGAGHISLSLAHMAGIVGFRVAVIDDRAEFANADRFPHADRVLVASVPDAFAQLPVDPNTYLVAVTRGHALDEEVVAHALRTPARYIGMIGSKRKVASVFDRLRARGFSDADIARVHAPIGLDIDAETVEEIAVSILAQLVAVRRSQP